MRRVGVLIIAILIAGSATPVGAEVTRAELREARDEVSQVSASLESELAVLDAILAQHANTQFRIATIEETMADREREIAFSALAAREQARAMYVSAGATALQATVSPEGITTLGTKNAYLDAVVDVDQDAVNQLVFLQQDFATLQSQLTVLLAEQEVLAEEVEAATAELMTELDEADAEYQALYSQWRTEEADRQRREAARLAAAAAAAAASGNFSSSAFVDASGRTCPVDGANTFRDSWLEPRSYRGGAHHGTDLIAAAGTRLVAIENGYVYSMSWHWAGGNGLYLRGNSGDIYYYAHMQGYVSGLSTGDRVGAGQLVGYVGSSGVSSISHLHLGYQPGGGGLVNPYQLMVKLCR